MSYRHSWRWRTANFMIWAAFFAAGFASLGFTMWVAVKAWTHLLAATHQLFS